MTDHTTMRAIRQERFGDSSVLRLTEVPVPESLPTEIRVRVHAAGVNPVDWKTREGRGMAAVLGAPPFGLGWDVSGVVDAVGFGVTTVVPGDEVYGMPWFPRAADAYAEYVTAPSRHFARKPTTIGHVEAAAVPLAALTAWQALVDTADVQPGQRVLIHAAAGGVGHLAVQIAVARGAYVIGTGSAGRAEFLHSLGADEFVDYRAVRFEEAVDEVDVVLDLVGEQDLTDLRSIQVLKPGGIHIGVPSGVRPEVAAAAAARGVRTTGILVEPDRAALASIADLIDAGGLRVVVQQTFPLEQAAAAHDAGATARTQGKIVLEVAA
ncbi:NADP-dependent oxidoreductase [Agromyces larvae]|uniref:NADP-dependent oxidoreductase n=1 Tax=Agromyces larvae TaxID=2929802 RepID=A0ABY4C2E1_9MICO|nr:NADP-dependent oxidoreductase [Agromyces larvae]UOE44143.1 NADP-dependent oxidoreductase [Agromyces larvae]